MTAANDEGIYRALFESPDCVYVHDLDGKLLDVNPACLELLGYRREELLGLDFFSLLDREHVAAAQRVLAELKETGRLQSRAEFRLGRKRGGCVDVEAGLSVVLREGRSHAVLGVARDITKLRETEKALARHNEALLRLNRFSVDLSLLPAEESLEAFVVRQLLDLTGGVGALFTRYDPTTRMTTVKHVEVDSGLLERVVRLLGRQLIGYQSPLSDELYETITTVGGRVSRTLHEASFRSVPRPVGAAIQALLNADRFIGVVYLVQGSLYGTSLVAMGRGTPDPPEAVLRNFSSRVALALRRRQVEATLRESEERHRLLADNASDVIWTMDMEGNLTYVSPSVERLRGFTAAELTGRSFISSLTPQSAVAARAAFAQAVAGIEAGRAATEFQGEVEQPRRDGSTVWTEQRVTEIRDPSGKWVGFLGVSRDITERKRAQADQEMSRQILQILNEPGDPVDSAERVVASIKAGAGFDVVGIRLKEGEDYPYVAALGFPEGFLEAENTLVERDGQGAVCRDKNGDASLECTCGLVISGRTTSEDPLFTKGGSFWTNDSSLLLELPASDDPRLRPRNLCIHRGYASIALVPIRDKQRIVGLLHVADQRKGRLSTEAVGRLEDIAAHIGAAIVRKQAEEALRASQERYENLVNVSPDAIVVDIDGIYTFVNPAAVRLLGARSPRELVGESIMDRIHPDFREIVKRRAGQAAAGTATAPHEITLLRLDGTPVEVEASAARIEFDGRWADQVVLRDITERRLAEAKQRELERRLQERQKLESLGVLAGGIAHDFNNMLTAILGYSDMILDGAAALPEDVLSDLTEIKGAAERAKALTGAILAFSRRQPRELQIISLGALVAELEPLLRRTLGEHIQLVCDLDEGSSSVEMDPSQMGQVLMNLVVNARDAMPAGGTLTIGITTGRLGHAGLEAAPALTSADRVLLEVSDTGVGIESEILPRIFEPFFTTKGPGEGTGLGLSTAYGIVKQSGGDILVWSEPGRGTTFEVYLPSAGADATGCDEPTPDREQAPRPPSASEGAGRTVLLVEDEPAVRRLATRLLRDQGYEVLVASDGQEALNLARDRSLLIDLVLTDVVLPGSMQGDAVARSILEERPGLKVVFMSGYPRDAIPSSGRLEEGMSYLEKPFTADALARKMREALGHDA